MRLFLLTALVVLAVKVFSSDYEKLKTEKTQTIVIVNK